MKSMLAKVGWKKGMVEKNVPFLPISGSMDDHFLRQEDSTGKLNMDWWQGNEVEAFGFQSMVKTLYEFLDKVCRVPERSRQQMLTRRTSLTQVSSYIFWLQLAGPNLLRFSCKTTI